MVNRFIAMVARVWSVMRGFRPFLIGPRPFGDRFPEKGFGKEHLRGKVCESVLLLFPPSVSFIDSTCPHYDIGSNVRQRIFHGCGRPMMFW